MERNRLKPKITFILFCSEYRIYFHTSCTTVIPGDWKLTGIIDQKSSLNYRRMRRIKGKMNVISDVVN